MRRALMEEAEWEESRRQEMARATFDHPRATENDPTLPEDRGARAAHAAFVTGGDSRAGAAARVSGAAGPTVWRDSTSTAMGWRQARLRDLLRLFTMREAPHRRGRDVGGVREVEGLVLERAGEPQYQELLRRWKRRSRRSKQRAQARKRGYRRAGGRRAGRLPGALGRGVEKCCCAGKRCWTAHRPQSANPAWPSGREAGSAARMRGADAGDTRERGGDEVRGGARANQVSNRTASSRRPRRAPAPRTS